MKLKQRAAAFGAAILMTAATAMPASAHHGHGNHCANIAAAASVLGETGLTALNQSQISGRCLGAFMAQMGKLEEFKAEKLRLKEEQLQAQVENGARTQEEADQILERMEARQSVCDGTGSGYGSGVCDGSGYGSGVCGGSGYGNGGGQGGGHHGGGRHCRW